MTFASVLFAPPDRRATRETPEAPAFFGDLNLDQVIDAVTADWAEYNLAPYFHLCPTDIETITYRQAIMREIDGKGLLRPIHSFAQHMRTMRHHLQQAEKLNQYRYQQERWLLDAIQIYCTAVRGLWHDLDGADLQSTGLIAFREYLRSYVESEPFALISAETDHLLVELSQVKYSLVINDLRVDVRRYDGEADYSAEVERTFARFRQGDVEEYRRTFSDAPQNDHIQERILERLARLYPATFAALDRYCARHAVFLDATLATFDREVQFYAAYLSYIAPLKAAGLTFCYPHVSVDSKDVYTYEGFDLALATKLVHTRSPIVCNDFSLHDGERILVVTGPNQGGKTTFARTFGQLHYLAAIGCPVPGRDARLFLFDRLFTHFEQVEDVRDRRGHLEEDLMRVHAILQRATPNSIIILNETFSSTTLQDAITVGTKVLETIIDLDALCVSVTFIDEFASLHPKVVSMVGTVLPDDPTVRTFVIQRKAADGLAYALAIAEQYGLTYQRLKGRIRA
jgi:DNA mismatch repair ATPase MutS